MSVIPFDQERRHARASADSSNLAKSGRNSVREIPVTSETRGKSSSSTLRAPISQRETVSRVTPSIPARFFCESERAVRKILRGCMSECVTYSVTPRQEPGVAGSVIVLDRPSGYVTGMVTKRNKGPFLREHRKAKGLSATDVAESMGMERESLLRLERELHRLNVPKQIEYAEAIGVEPAALWTHPSTPSIEQRVAELEKRNIKTGT